MSTPSPDTSPPDQPQMNIGRVFLITAGALLVIMLVLNAIGGSSEPTTTTQEGRASADDCHAARVRYWASSDAKDRLAAEGRLTAELERFHNDVILSEGRFLVGRCDGDVSRP